MKEPQIVSLIIRLDDKQEQQQFKFPLKKINMIYELQRDRLMRFLIIQKIIKQSEEKQIILQFYDHQSQKYISEHKLKASNQNFEFTEDFIKDQQEYKLIIMLFYDINFAQLIEINQTIEVFEKEKNASQHTQNDLKTQFKEQQEQFQKLQEDLEYIKSKVSQLQTQKSKVQLDLVILYSNPIIRIKNDIQPALFVDYKSEINTILNSISGMRYQIFKASSENLEIALSYEPIIVHLVTHGDFDEQKESYYFDFQDDGLLNKLYSQEFSEILSKNESTRTKVICISSIVGKNFVEFIPKQFHSIVNMKFHNSPDNMGSIFWETFYKNFSDGTSLLGSYNKAKEELILKFQKVEKKQTCCCLHKHIEGCIRDPSKKGYELNHSKHVNCAVQVFQHDMKNCLEFQKEPRAQQQCGKICLGLLKHKFIKSRCKNNGDDKCEKILELLNEIALSCGIPEEENNNFEFDVSLGNENQQEYCWACCCEITLRLQKKKKDQEQEQEELDFEIINNHHYDHSILQKISIYQPDNNYIDLTVDGKNNQEEYFFQYPDKQIILIHNRNNEQKQFQERVIQTIQQYFEEYLNVMSKDRKLCIKELNFQNCDLENWKQYVADQLEIQFSEQDFFENLETFFQKLKDSEQKYHHIFILEHIDKIYESNLFKEFYRHFQEIKSNFILILTVNNIIKEKLKEIVAHAEVQLIDIDLLQALKDKSWQTSFEDEQK